MCIEIHLIRFTASLFFIIRLYIPAPLPCELLADCHVTSSYSRQCDYMYSTKISKESWRFLFYIIWMMGTDIRNHYRYSSRRCSNVGGLCTLTAVRKLINTLLTNTYWLVDGRNIISYALGSSRLHWPPLTTTYACDSTSLISVSIIQTPWLWNLT